MSSVYEGNFRSHHRHYYLDMSENEPSDRTLVRAARAGDDQAFVRLVERHRPLLTAVCRRAGDPSVADDAVQEALLQAMLSLDKLRDDSRFGAWLVGIGLNRLRQLARAQRRAGILAGSLLGGIMLHQRDDPALAVEQSEIAAEVREAVGMLPEGQRRAVEAFYFSGLTYEESAEALGTRAGSVKARLHKARKALKDRLEAAIKEERVMVISGSNDVEMRVRDVRRRLEETDLAYMVVILEEVGGARHLPIWVGPFEGTSIAIHLQGIKTPRPLTFTLMSELLRRSATRVTEARIQRLDGSTFYATVGLTPGRKNVSVDARPSDAIALALVEGVRIYASEQVLTASEAQMEARAAEDKWHGEGTIGAKEIAAEVVSRWRPATEESGAEE